MKKNLKFTIFAALHSPTVCFSGCVLSNKSMNCLDLILLPAQMCKY